MKILKCKPSFNELVTQQQFLLLDNCRVGFKGARSAAFSG